MTARKPQVRRRTRHALILMPALHCTRPGCGSDPFEPVGDYRDTYRAAQAAGWGYLRGEHGGHGFLCPKDSGYRPWWPEPAVRLAIAAPDVPRPDPVRAGNGPGDPSVPGPGAREPDPPSGDLHRAAGPGHLDDTVTDLPAEQTREMTVILPAHPDHGPEWRALEQDMADLDGDGPQC